jgi:hypothetical protein
MAIDTEGTPFDPLNEPAPAPPDHGEVIADLYAKLSKCAGGLNEASDELGRSMSEVDMAVQNLNLGVSAWIDIPGGWEDPWGAYCKWQLGYDRVGKRWGIALRTVDGADDRPDDDITPWLFNDAPRAMRVEAIEKLPDLLRALIAKVDDTAAAIERKTSRAREFAQGIATLTPRRK